MPAISYHLEKAAQILAENGITEARREAASLMMLAIEKDKVFFVAHSDYLLGKDEEEKFENFLLRRAAREPFQYIAGRQEFYNLDFLVTPDVLIPRPETEILVEKAIEILREKENPRFCDVGLGSGCISISILYSVENAAAVGLDVSENALKIALRNAQKHQVEKRLIIKKSDVFDALNNNEKFDLIVSNPPYIPLGDIEHLQAEVRDYEPLNALTDGTSGFEILKKIIAAAPKFLLPYGALLLEIGFTQSEKVESFFSKNIWHSVEVFADLQGIPRTVLAVLR